MYDAAFTLFIKVSTIFYAQPLSIKQANTANSLHSSCPSRLHPPEMIDVVRYEAFGKIREAQSRLKGGLPLTRCGGCRLFNCFLAAKSLDQQKLWISKSKSQPRSSFLP